MQKQVAVLIATLIVFSVGAVAVEWEETDWGAEVILDASTGLPAVVFHATLEYSEFPDNYYLDGGWEIYEVVNGVRIPIEGAPTTARLRGDTLTIASATNQIPVEEGKTYGARLSLQDTVNGLSYERTFSYSPAEVLPIGISLRGWDGSLEEIDLSGLPDEELEELAVLHDMLKGYAVSPDDQTLDTFLRGDAATRPDTAILLTGALGAGEEIDRCTYSACDAGCCSTCVEHEAEEEPSSEESEESAPDVRIECIAYEGAHFEEDGNEYVQIKNYGDLGQDLLGWTLANANDTSEVFTFMESFVLEPGMSIRVYTNELYAGASGFSFGLEESIWTNVVLYPVSVVLLPVPPGTISSSGTGITFRVVLTLYTYTLSSRNDIALVQNQLTQFGQEFTGTIYVGSGSSIVGGGKTVFVHEIALQILETAALEIKNR
jgi:hypothetical protein